MNRIVRLQPHLRAIPLDGQSLFLLGERERFLLTGAANARVIPLLDGQRRVGDVIAELDGTLSGLEVFFTIELLLAKGYATTDAPCAEPARDAFWRALEVAPARAERGLADRRVRLELLAGGGDEAPLRAALAGAGLELASAGEGGLALVVAGDYLDPRLAETNRRALEAGEPWMLVKPGGVVPWIGPVFDPGRGPCWECLAFRLRANRPVETFLRRRGIALPFPAAPEACLPAARALALQLSATMLARWAAGRAEGGASLRTLDLDALALTEHVVVRRPQCPRCGDPELLRRRATSPPQLARRDKAFTEDGGHRVVAPTQTWERLRHQISPLTGVVSSIGVLPGCDHPLRTVYGAGWFSCPPVDRPDFEDFHRSSLGKGRSPAQARASALCEAIERWSASFHGDEPVITATAAELGDAAVTPPELMLLSEAQYRTRDEWNARARLRGERIPPPWQPDRPLLWTPAWSLSKGSCRYVPAMLAFADLPISEEEYCCPIDSNGDAAGNCLEEAILQGLLELVERDAVGIWWYNRLQRPAVDLESFGDPFFPELVAHFASLGHSLWVLDVTSDLGIPTFVAYGESEDGRRFSIGCGCHHEARLGVQRALTEFVQLYDPAGQRPLPWDLAALPDRTYLKPDPAAPPRRASDYPVPPGDELLAEIQDGVDRVGRAGLELLVLDRSRPDVDLCCVKVIVPGLRHFWPRFAPGRLYDVPVQLGWRTRPLAEDELNPQPCLL